MSFAAREKKELTIRTSPTQEKKNFEFCDLGKKKVTYKITIKIYSTQGKTMSFATKQKKKNLQNHNKNLPHQGKKNY